MLAISASLASAAATLSLQNAILLETLRDTEGTMVKFALAIWKTLTPNAEPIGRIQTHSTSMGHTGGTPRLHTSTDKMRHAGCHGQAFKAVAAPHADDWLNAPPITAIGLRLSDERLALLSDSGWLYYLSTTHMHLWQNGRR